ncbi:MAG: ribonuclease Y [Pseudomonadota bacterium]
MSTLITVLIATGAVLVGAFLGILAYRSIERKRIGSPDSQATKLLEVAQKEASSIKRNAELEAKELLIQTRTTAEQENQQRLKKLQNQKDQILRREETLRKKSQLLADQETAMHKKEQELTRRELTAEASAKSSQELLARASKRLEDLAKMTPEQARDLLVQQVKDEAKEIAASHIKKIEEETEKEARAKATTIVATAIQRYASEYVSDRTVSVVQLPSNEMKGRIIGREGRNIRALEAATGVDLIIDDTPEAVILSCFNPLRREVARLALTKLISDGRIHPSRIEEVVKRCEEEVTASCKEAGEQAVFDLGLHRVHPELVKTVGELKFRSAYAQNLLVHSVEVAFVAGVMASELGTNVKQARRAGLLHDIGKAVPHEIEGSHALVGSNLAKKYNESPAVIHAIAAHHNDPEPASVLAHIVFAANQLSARRPGARREKLHSYVQRLNDLEKLCTSYKGVKNAWAIQAGREIRIIVENTEVSDDMAVLLSKDIAKQVENEMNYPGEIKVCVVRESRASDVAH